MKTLPEKLSLNGFEYEKVIRIGKKCICCQKIASNCFRFEVFVVKVKKKYLYLRKIYTGKGKVSKG
jgi:hypothetical protein